jgi:hypothetical protein
MPSGKQILLSLLNECCQRLVEGQDVEVVSEQLKAGLLLHGSTPDEMWFHVDRMAWISENEDGEIVRQGLGLREKNIFLSDLFECMVSNEIPDKVIEEYPNLTKNEYNSATSIIWCLLSSLQFFSQLISVENDGNLDEVQAEKLVDGYRKKLEKFRENPDEIIGQKGFRG